MGDCAINIKPNEDDLVEIAAETANCARVFGVDPKVAFLSYSTHGSGSGEDVDKMRNATRKCKAAHPDLPIEGEIQFDAAVAPRVAKIKCPDSEVAGYANTFVFPDINAGNIGYKIAQRLGSFNAYGPILLGLNAPVNDLSRGCNAEEVTPWQSSPQLWHKHPLLLSQKTSNPSGRTLCQSGFLLFAAHRTKKGKKHEKRGCPFQLLLHSPFFWTLFVRKCK